MCGWCHHNSYTEHTEDTVSIYWRSASTNTCLNACHGSTAWGVCAGYTHPWIAVSIHNRMPTSFNHGVWQRIWQAVIIHVESDCRPGDDAVNSYLSVLCWCAMAKWWEWVCFICPSLCCWPVHYSEDPASSRYDHACGICPKKKRGWAPCWIHAFNVINSYSFQHWKPS